MFDFFLSLLEPIKWLVAWIMFGFHEALTFIGMPASSGWTWALSIVGLVIVMRAAMIPLFVKQIMLPGRCSSSSPSCRRSRRVQGKKDPTRVRR